MLEQALGAPILQLAAGSFLSDANRVSLAVLHPRAIAVYSVSAVTSAGSPTGGTNETSYYKLTLAWEHALEHPACNFVHGPFGGVYGHELICIQSMDGQLTVLEQDRLVFERKLGRCLLPGPLTYCAKADLLLTYASRMEMECYKYSANVLPTPSRGCRHTSARHATAALTPCHWRPRPLRARVRFSSRRWQAGRAAAGVERCAS